MNPKQWILIDSASQFGLDKKPFQERLAFGREILALIQEGADMTPWIEKAKERELFAKSLITIQDAIDGVPNGHLIGLDAASSGPQLLSVLSRCIIGMSNTGALGEEVPDLYSAIYKNMENEGLTREQVKKACIPFVYGSQKAPERVFGEDAHSFTQAYEKAVPTAYAVREVLLAAWNAEALFHEWMLPDGHTAHVKVMDTVDVKGKFLNKAYTQRVQINRAMKKGMSLPANVIHSYDAFVVREVTGRCAWSTKVVDGIAAIKHHLKHGSLNREPKLLALEKLSEEFNFVSIQGYEFIQRDCLDGLSVSYLEKLLALGMSVIKYPSFDIRAVHDELACHANHVGYMQSMYNQVLAESYASSWLEKVLLKLTSVDFKNVFPTPSKEIFKAIQIAQYALH